MNSTFPSLRRRHAVALLGAAALPGLARAQAKFPDKPITLIVPFAPGGIADITARAVSEVMAQKLGQAVIVDNRPSAGSIVASQAVATAKPDGHTLLLMSNGNAVSVGLFKKLPYDTKKDFVGISTLGYFDLGLFVASGSKFASLKDLVAYARAHPGKLNVGTIAAGSTQHLAAKLFETVAGLEVALIPYKGSPAVLTALRGGEIDVAFEILGPMLPQVQAGVVKALAVSGDKRNPALPEVPTAMEAGVAGYNVASWNALAAPAGTPAAVVEVLNRAAREAVASPAVRDKLARLGMRVAASSPAELEKLLASEIDRWSAVIRAARIEPE
ncbi:tripartite tricarboxylate transporter substrate binding protein [Piscinibacter sp. HJYY11]|uniref:Bug family tripartite tricarboxylate transporter substrate binding protein n=1 Tax=Piscinibacter sp. HJYY11 TaxID=2801333 RepID=UPI00191E59A5|nr:tripartite tricarboxylate transporter substrate binding protein [Piscinibacter sp. HJYY11]MBL0727857.1 tripartite tricarboxylate transporter substrate binding protein [Piscinibacter sp. HJYY11]